ncbi:DUF2326 domain-containing protein [Propionimicrobium lymphophilum]|uniref:DUF2326 domain-containing protein n=1 Tax=Propionimicrobium lymphophilum TaxID=33012 RepID=UPI0023F0018F|nr:DUF2326 domain-containing protein [Propionimicrobium lymphophilum]
MLTELYCDAFKPSCPKPITFTPGLNIILGTKGATNSIGKSTMLMILDYVFGGDDYLRLSKDVKHNIGDHTFKFAFDFKGERHYYMRGTQSPNEITVCDSSYTPITTQPLKDFRDVLAIGYGVSANGTTWRNMVSGSFRIWQRDNDKTTLPLSTHRSDTHRAGITRLLALFGVLGEVQEALLLEEEAKAAVEAAKVAAQHYSLNIAKNKKEVEENLKRIEQLEQQVKELEATFHTANKSEMSAEQAKIVAGLRREETPLLRQQTRLINQLNALNANTELAGKNRASTVIEQLAEFFPEADLARLEQVEHFRKNVKNIVTKQAKKQIAQAEEKLAAVQQNLRKVNAQIAEIVEPGSIDIKTADSLHVLKSELGRLKAANKAYEKKREFEEQKRLAQERVEKDSKNLLKDIEKKMNHALKHIDGQFTKEQRNPPKLTLKSIDKYAYAIADDTGTGSGYRSLLSFDIALLEESSLPVSIEDSMMFKQIETDAVERIVAHLSTYEMKQAFIALDEIEKYDKSTQEIIQAHTRLKLGPGCEALFGREWGKKNK